jgi:hypothetical protein
MRLSEAIRLGAALRGQAFGFGYSEFKQRTCAVGAAAEAVGLYKIDAEGRCVQTDVDIFAALPMLKVPTICPLCRYRGATGNVMAHLNDWHRWTREAIADWVVVEETVAEQTVVG